LSKKQRQTSRRIFLSFLPRLEIFEALPQEDVVLLLRVVELVAHGPEVNFNTIFNTTYFRLKNLGQKYVPERSKSIANIPT
jgi:hypothetical protein